MRKAVSRKARAALSATAALGVSALQVGPVVDVAEPAPQARCEMPTAPQPPKLKQATVALSDMPAAHRENPEKLSGQALKDLANRRGLSKSSMADMSDERIRTQLRYRAYQQYEEDVAVA